MSEHEIDNLYGYHDVPPDGNIIAFEPPMGPQEAEIIDNVHALLSNADTRQYSRKVLQSALEQIGADFVKASLLEAQQRRKP